MRDYETLIKALRTCELSTPCSECPYYDEKGPTAECATMNIDAADAIEELIAAVPKQGEWLPHSNPQFIEVDVCSVCGLGTRKMHHCTDGVQTWDEKTFFRYCPWCGAKLSEPPKEVQDND